MSEDDRLLVAVRKFQIQEADHPVWSRSFNDRTKLCQMEEDLFAGRSVSAVLVAIVSFGLVLGTLGVVLCI